MTSFLLIASLIFFSEANLLPSSCNGLEDGVHELQLIESDTLPSIKVVCSNNYIIIDYSLDNNVASYFSTWKSWYKNIVGPSNNEVVSWNEWFHPAKQAENTSIDISFLVSPDCSVCDEDSGFQYENDISAYYMVGSIYGCGWKRYATYDCDYRLDENTNEYLCNSCADSSSPKFLDENADYTDYKTTGICPIQIKKSSYSSSACQGNPLKPSLGINGEHCVCYKPSQTNYYKKVESTKTTDNKEISSNTENNDISIDINKLPIYKLTQNDFKDGPYRITESGYYIIQEDIEFNFNEGSVNDPFADDAWWPTSEQNDDYPGSNGESGGAWYLGFFAGITIEASHVTLDLNNHEIKMADNFYYMQRWFVCIELSTQYFRPGEGPFMNFGGDPVYASNVVIKNGKIGLSSHHGIHGNDNNDVILKDLDISNFETHGIQLNGFNTVKIVNVDIHDNSKQVYFTPHFARMKGMLTRFRSVMYENDDGRDIYFKNRDEPTTYSEVMEKLENKMKLVWDYVLYDKTPELGENGDITVAEWHDALYTFYNEDGYFYGASVHGIFLNTFGATILSYRMSNILHSNNAILKNVKIYNLDHKVKENIGFSAEFAKPWSDYFVSPYDSRMLWGDHFVFKTYDSTSPPKELPAYVGNTLSDAMALYDHYSTTWEQRHVMRDLSYLFIDFDKTGFEQTQSYSSDKYYTLMCNTDQMLHDVKGINGIRIDAVDNVHLNNIEIFNIHSHTNLGYEVCGEYGFKPKSGAFRTGLPVQKGYAGHNLVGISIINTESTYLNDIKINNLISNNGISYGIAIWPNAKVILNGDINIYDLYAGHELEEGLYAYNATPNQAPDACGILFYDYFRASTEGQGATYKSHYKLMSDINFNFKNINGHYGCLGSDWTSMINDTSPKTSKLLKSSVIEFIKSNYDQSGILKTKSSKVVHKIFKSKTAIFIYQVLGIVITLAAIILICGFGLMKCDKYKDYQQL